MTLGLEVNHGISGDVAAVLFLQSINSAMDTMSALNSSPWTSENFGADPEKAKTSREYVAHSIAVSGAMCVLAAYVAKSWWPIIGMALTNAYLWWIYDRALSRGACSGSTDWSGNG